MEKYNPKELQKYYKTWEKFFHSENESSKPPFAIILPPPNVTGVLHMGHALTVTIEDVIVRYKRMMGFNTVWLPGTDHAGIATQMVVERELMKQGLSRHDLGREKFLEKVWELSKKHHDVIISQLKQLGVSLDWERERFSLDEKFNKAVNKVFINLYEKGLIYRSEKLISWCSRCGTALSDLEVATSQEKGKLYFLKYFFKDSLKEFLVVATTRPETLFGDMAVAINPNDERFFKYHGRKVIIPFVNREVPIILDDYVDINFGTGCLKITPAHDFNDNELAKKHKLAMTCVIDKNGFMNEEALLYKGLKALDARTKIIIDLEKLGALEKVEDYEMNLSKCSRCDTVLEPLLSKQWFVKMEAMAKKAIDVVKNEEIKFYPRGWWEQTYYNWLENIRDWCLSRQLWWGHRIPVWHCQMCSEFFVSEAKPLKCTCGSDSFEQDSDVLDTWFSAALWPFVAFGWPDKTKELKTFYPNQLMETGFDIIFFWVARMIMFGLEFMDAVPFKHVLFHAMVRDEKGQKMSKTKGNVVDPLNVIEKYSTDALRFSLASYAGNARDIKFSESVIENYHYFMNKIWQASNFVYINTTDYKQIKLDAVKHFVNRWMLETFNIFLKKIHEEFETYSLDKACEHIYKFFKNDYCDKYIECSKVLLKSEEYSLETKFVLLYVHLETLKILHPFIPYITEELYQNSPLKKYSSIMEESFPLFDSKINYEQEVLKFNLMDEIIYSIRNIKATYNINTKIKVFVSGYKDLENFKEFICMQAGLDEFKIIEAEFSISSSIKFNVKDVLLTIPAGEYIDFNVERERILKKLEKVNKDFSIFNGKLNNPKFLNTASFEIIEKDKIKLTEISKIKLELEKALEMLKG